MTHNPVDYASAGVNLQAASEAMARIRGHVNSTATPGVLGAFGSFGGMFRAPSSGNGSAQVLVASADGVGTKLKVAVLADRHHTIGQDLVNHCVNDILVQGATPLFFLDYVAFGRLVPQVLEQIVAGVAQGCRENGCALLGGETAEMPGLYTPPDYDLAGFIVGSVPEGDILGPERVRKGDVLLALASSGLHTNGYSLARKIVFERLGLGPGDPFPGGNETVADVLLRVHRSYLSVLTPFLKRIHAMAHITGGGISGNLNRVLPDHLSAVADRSTFSPPVVFKVLQDAGEVPDREMYDAFNMGVGMVVVCDRRDADEIRQASEAAGVSAWLLGEIVSGNGSVELI